MEPEACWEHLEIEPCQDRKAIKRAFAAQLKKIDQEAEPLRYQQLREAYDLAKNLAELPRTVFLELVEGASGSDNEVGEALSEVEPQEPPADEAAEGGVPFSSTLFDDTVGLRDPIDAARSDAAGIVVDLINALLREDETTACDVLKGIRRSESYANDPVYGQEVEFLLIVGLLEVSWDRFPLAFCLQVTEPWMEDRLDVDSPAWVVETEHPYWFEYYELCHRVKAELVRQRYNESLAEPNGSDFDKAIDLVMNRRPEDMSSLVIPRIKTNVSSIIGRLSADVSGAFETWMMDNSRWAAWVDWEMARRKSGEHTGKLMFYSIMIFFLFLVTGSYSGLNMFWGSIFSMSTLWVLYLLGLFTLKRPLSLVSKGLAVVLYAVWYLSGLFLMSSYSGGFRFTILFGIPILAVFLVTRFWERLAPKAPAQFHHPESPVLRAPRVH